MSKYTSFKAGGRAKALIIPETFNELKETLVKLSKSGEQYQVIGNGSNILVCDSGYNGSIVKLGFAFAGISKKGDEITVGAGALLSSVATIAMEEGLSGLEFASGIPGSIGGAVFMNAGAYEGEMKDIVKCVNLISKDGMREFTVNADDMGFAYRYCMLHDTEDVVTSVTLKLKSGKRDEIKDKMRELMERRNSKQPVSLPSAGSVFKRPAGHFAGKLIEDAGLKGLTLGGAKVSELHAGFIVNYNNATATDIIDLINVVKETVYDKFGVELEPEIMII